MLLGTLTLGLSSSDNLPGLPLESSEIFQPTESTSAISLTNQTSNSVIEVCFCMFSLSFGKVGKRVTIRLLHARVNNVCTVATELNAKDKGLGMQLAMHTQREANLVLFFFCEDGPLGLSKQNTDGMGTNK